MSQEEINGWLNVVIMLFVNAYLIWVLVRVSRWAQRAGKSYLGILQLEPWKADCGPHRWEREKYIDINGEEVHVLYCDECGMISGSDRYFSKEAIERVTKAGMNGTERRDS